MKMDLLPSSVRAEQKVKVIGEPHERGALHFKKNKMNIIEILKNIQETQVSEVEEKNYSFYDKCFNLKSPMHFTDKIGTIEDINELMDFLESKLIYKEQTLKITNSIFSLPPEKSTNLNFI